MPEVLGPGRELDVLVAEKVMELKPPSGFSYSPRGKDWRRWEPEQYSNGEFTRSDVLETWPPNFSTSISAAWEVVEKLGETDSWELHYVPSPVDRERWQVAILHFASGEEYLVEADTAPHAICLAALKAVENG
jgi:hypothetical protein